MVRRINFFSIRNKIRIRNRLRSPRIYIRRRRRFYSNPIIDNKVKNIILSLDI